MGKRNYFSIAEEGWFRDK